ncbi:hypothetical protein LC605_06355 [Nostoc sp. CHAB 5836]|uniref:hypothetical protein n=1 Tax=Nostoc sp. CHAB 5836 TaxID=2780404 RepID=UPI001E29816E|nr:hypothetical protein [Nostoc sp. CHAB 5836]MCC5614702.1 hypothetical protein [Nostoc sp. CHAB 5836]
MPHAHLPCPSLREALAFDYAVRLRFHLFLGYANEQSRDADRKLTKREVVRECDRTRRDAQCLMPHAQSKIQNPKSKIQNCYG